MPPVTSSRAAVRPSSIPASLWMEYSVLPLGLDAIVLSHSAQGKPRTRRQGAIGPPDAPWQCFEATVFGICSVNSPGGNERISGSLRRFFHQNPNPSSEKRKGRTTGCSGGHTTTGGGSSGSYRPCNFKASVPLYLRGTQDLSRASPE